MCGLFKGANGQFVSPSRGRVLHGKMDWLVFMSQVRHLALPLLLSCTIHFLGLVFLFSFPVSIHKGSGGMKQSALQTRLVSSSDVQKVRGALTPNSENQKPDVAWHENGSPALRREAGKAWPGGAEQAGRPSRSFPHPVFYSVSELTVLPQPLADPELELETGAENPVSGGMVLDLWINEEGHVIHTVPESTDLPESVAWRVEKAFQKLRFIPGELNGRKVGVVMQIEVRYENGVTLE